MGWGRGGGVVGGGWRIGLGQGGGRKKGNGSVGVYEVIPQFNKGPYTV